MFQRGQIPPHIGRALALRLGLRSHPAGHGRDFLIPLPAHDALPLQIALGGEFDLERDEGAAGAGLVFSGERLAADGAGAFGFAVVRQGAGVVAALCGAKAEGVEDAFVAEEVAWGGGGWMVSI